MEDRENGGTHPNNEGQNLIVGKTLEQAGESWKFLVGNGGAKRARPIQSGTIENLDLAGVNRCWTVALVSVLFYHLKMISH